MQDFLIVRKSRNLASSVIHILLNITLAIIASSITIISDNLFLGFIPILASKWRIFAVRPRFWSINLRSNLVDLIVGFSFVILNYSSGLDLNFAHFAFTALYILWLTVLKPKSSESAIIAQSLISVVVGSASAIIILPLEHSIYLVFVCAFLGYSATRHFLSQKTDQKNSYLPLLSALLFAEITWISHLWLISYHFKLLHLIIPQLSLILLLFSISFGSILKSILEREKEVKIKDFIKPFLFGLILSLILILFFSNPAFNL